jgi:hypothetical protein
MALRIADAYQCLESLSRWGGPTGIHIVVCSEDSLASFYINVVKVKND